MADPELNDRAEVRAAGGLVWRRTPAGEVQVLVVHRPRYDDWSLPKGKADPGESDEQCALREVKEETGLTCRLGPELPGVRYLDRHGRPKAVRYWAMEPEDAGAPVATPASPAGGALPEVDCARWLAPPEAIAVLTYCRDREVLGAFSAEGA